MSIVGLNYNKMYRMELKILQIHTIKKIIEPYKGKNKILKQRLIFKWVGNQACYRKVMTLTYKREIKILNEQKHNKMIIKFKKANLNIRYFKRFNRNKSILTQIPQIKFQSVPIHLKLAKDRV